MLSVLHERNRMYKYTKMLNSLKINAYTKHTQCVIHNEQSNGLSVMSLFVLSHLFMNVFIELTIPVSSII